MIARLAHTNTYSVAVVADSVDRSLNGCDNSRLNAILMCSTRQNRAPYGTKTRNDELRRGTSQTLQHRVAEEEQPFSSRSWTECYGIQTVLCLRRRGGYYITDAHDCLKTRNDCVIISSVFITKKRAAFGKQLFLFSWPIPIWTTESLSKRRYCGLF